MQLTTTAKAPVRERMAALFGASALLAGLILWALWGNGAAYLALILALPAALLNWHRQDWSALLRARWVWALWAGFALLSFSFLFQPGQPSLASIGDFLILALAPIIAASVAPVVRHKLDLRNLSVALLLAVLLAACVGVTGIMDGNSRASAPGLSPIHFADLAIICGFMGLGLILLEDQAWRWIGLLGPVLGIVAAIASGTRAALFVACILAMVFGVFLIRRLHAPLWLKLLIPPAMAIAIVGAFYVANLLGFTRPWDAVTVIVRLLTGQIWTDTSSAYRVEMFVAGWRAFLDAPFLGHGWHNQLSAALPYLSERAVEGYQSEGWGYIHNDALSLAVAAGIPGFLAYCLFIAAPLLATRTWGTTDAPLYLALTFVLGLFASGMTDVLFMVEAPKVMLVQVSAVLFFATVARKR